MRFVGATPEMEQTINEWMLDIHPYTVEFEIKLGNNFPKAVPNLKKSPPVYAKR